MYMITIVQSEAYKVTGDTKYINRAAKEMVLYLMNFNTTTASFIMHPTCPTTGDAVTAGWPWA